MNCKIDDPPHRPQIRNIIILILRWEVLIILFMFLRKSDGLPSSSTLSHSVPSSHGFTSLKLLTPNAAARLSTGPLRYAQAGYDRALERADVAWKARSLLDSGTPAHEAREWRPGETLIQSSSCHSTVNGTTRQFAVVSTLYFEDAP